jgi:copper amine oxidase-like protein
MKRKLSLLLVLAMILTLVPMSAFASSTNDVDKVPKVNDEKAFVYVNDGEHNDAPVLRIEENTDGDIKDGNKFRLTLSGAGAEWNYVKDNKENATVINTVYNCITKESNPQAGAWAEVKYISTTKIDVTVKDPSDVLGGDKTKTTRIDFPMDVTIDGKGEAKVIINPLDTSISGTTVTYAVASDGGTVITVDDPEKIRRGDAEEAAELVFDETAINSVEGEQHFELELPEGFEWDKDATEVDTEAFGHAVKYKEWKEDKNGDPDKEVLVVKFDADKGTSRRTFTVRPIIDVTRDAKYGKVEVDVKERKGDVDDQKNVLIAEYYGYTVELSVDEVEEFYAGRVDEDYVTGEIKLEEKVANSIIRDRVIEFELPQGVQIQDGEEIGEIDSDYTNFEFTYHYEGDVDEDTSKFEAEIKSKDKDGNVTDFDGKEGAAITFELPLTVEADFTGDIELKVKGAGIEEQSVVIAKALAPLEVEIEVADVKVGLQNQAAPDIIIKEAAAGTLQEDEYLTLAFDNNYEMNFEDAVIEVVSGDVKIDQDKSGVGETDSEDKSIDIYIDRDSEEASVIKVSGIKLNLDRSVPEGPFEIDVTGRAIVQNGGIGDTAATKTKEAVDTDYNDEDFTDTFVSVEFANVITKVSQDFHATSKFVVGDAKYTVLTNGEEIEKTMDVAPFVNADGRTLLPVRYMANAVGLSSDQIVWNPETRTVTLFGDKVVQVTIDSNVLIVSGTPITMDTAAVIKDGRTFLPVRFIAQALGFDVDWEAATKTVTVEK